MSESWRARAACVDADRRLFFPPEGGQAVALALAVCAGCPVRVECLDACYAQPSRLEVFHGVWGGTLPVDRRNPERAYRVAREGRVRLSVGRVARHGGEVLYRRGCRCERCVAGATERAAAGRRRWAQRHRERAS